MDKLIYSNCTKMINYFYSIFQFSKFFELIIIEFS